MDVRLPGYLSRCAVARCKTVKAVHPVIPSAQPGLKVDLPHTEAGTFERQIEPARHGQEFPVAAVERADGASALAHQPECQDDRHDHDHGASHDRQRDFLLVAGPLVEAAEGRARKLPCASRQRYVLQHGIGMKRRILAEEGIADVGAIGNVANAKCDRRVSPCGDRAASGLGLEIRAEINRAFIDHGFDETPENRLAVRAGENGEVDVETGGAVGKHQQAADGCAPMGLRPLRSRALGVEPVEPCACHPGLLHGWHDPGNDTVGREADAADAGIAFHDLRGECGEPGPRNVAVKRDIVRKAGKSDRVTIDVRLDLFLDEAQRALDVASQGVPEVRAVLRLVDMPGCQKDQRRHEGRDKGGAGETHQDRRPGANSVPDSRHVTRFPVRLPNV